ncbi:MAG: hypothetical protein EBT28_10395 [Betaproteobacteria bacterium]|nr:hypothetical protein [Betaproteobacteria bacterium]
MQQILLWVGLLFHTALFAQTSKECELIQQRIAGTGNVNNVCSALYQECAKESVKKTDPKEAQNQCSKNLGSCQMAGQLSGEDLQLVIDEYKTACQK